MIISSWDWCVPQKKKQQSSHLQLLHNSLAREQSSHLQLLKNSLARSVTGTPKTEHIAHILKFLHWLKIEERIHYKIIIFMSYDILHTSKPFYLRSLINFKPHRSTRSSDYLTKLRLHISTIKISDRFFQQTTPTISINLPPSIKTFANTTPNLLENDYTSSFPRSLSKTQFRFQLKIYLFHNS